MNVGKISTSVLLSFLSIMFMTVMGCGHKDATSALSGDVTGSITANVLINLTGDATLSATTDDGGKFSFGSTDNGYYTITPYFDGYTFVPASIDVTVSGASVTGANFVSTFTGYTVSGNVTLDGVGQEGVTIIESSDFPGIGTTAADGSYTTSPGITTRDVVNATLTPSLKGYKFTPYSRDVTVHAASVTGKDFVSSLAHSAGTADGTYTWDSTAGVLIITWTSADFPCNWPRIGTDTELAVTITATTMTWRGLVWTRVSGTVNDPAGAWTATDDSGNIYSAKIDSTKGSISLSGTMVACAHVSTEHYADHYTVLPSYQDPDNLVTSVSVTGTGITTSSLTYNATTTTWLPAGSSDLGATHAPLPDVYKFTITDSGTTWVENATISCFVENFATGLSPSGPISDPHITVSWTGVIDAGAAYMVELFDSSNNLLGLSMPSLNTSAYYDGSATLISGHTYHYNVIVIGTTACSNGRSFSSGSFIYSP